MVIYEPLPKMTTSKVTGGNNMDVNIFCVILVILAAMTTDVQLVTAAVDNTNYNKATMEDTANFRNSRSLDDGLPQESVARTILSQTQTNISDSETNGSNATSGHHGSIRRTIQGVIPEATVNQQPSNHFQNSTTSDNAPGNKDISKIESEYLMSPEWWGFCNASYRYVSGSNFTNQWAVFVSCRLMAGNHWSLRGYRTWMAANENRLLRYIPKGQQLRFAVELKCTKGGKVSIPYPARARYLWYLTVDNCAILDNLLEYNVTDNSTDILSVKEFTNVVLEIDANQFYESIVNFRHGSRQFHCGGEQLEKYVYRNIKMEFINMPNMETMEQQTQGDDTEQRQRPMSQSNFRGAESTTLNVLDGHKINLFSEHEMAHVDGIQSPNKNHPAGVGSVMPQISESSISDSAARLGQENQEIQFLCQFSRMRYFDESISDIISKQHFQFLDEHSRYPVLEYYNISHSKIREMSPHLLQWRRYFPKMKYMDLSHNKITYFGTFADNGLNNDPPGVLDLRHNNITTLTKEDMDALNLQSRTVFVDIRDNPFVCDCQFTDALHIIINKSAGVLTKYPYLSDLACHKPNNLKGTRISTLDNNFCEELEFIVSSIPIIILSIIIVLLMAIVVMTVRYRKEIMILAFTRCHISLPCREVEKNGEKKYDAFIAYSEYDFNWVRHTLLPRLEGLENGHGHENEQKFKLCLHHRDFPVGGSITENILEKVNESRHTILILSNNFLQSKWCQYEFKQAFTQSLLEKKKHLLMILMEELDQKLIESELKRCLKTFTYIKLEDRLFWDKIIFALSDKKNDKRVVHNEEIMDMQNNNREVDQMKIHQIANENVEQNVHPQVKQDEQNYENIQIDENIGNPRNDPQRKQATDLLKQARVNFRDVRNGHEQVIIQDGIWDV